MDMSPAPNLSASAKLELLYGKPLLPSAVFRRGPRERVFVRGAEENGTPNDL